jgi:hypothetical protein
MAKPYNTKLIMMVAQGWFEAGDNQFCKLLPVVYTDGERPKAEMFANDGEIWWMLTARTALLAQPGRIVTGTLEDAVRFDEEDPNASRFQVKIHSVSEVDAKDGMQVLDLPGGAVASIEDLVSEGFRLEQVARPTPTVLVRWRGNVYGPFVMSKDQKPSSEMRDRFVLCPADTNSMTVFEIAESAFRQSSKGFCVNFAEEVSLSNDRRSDSSQRQRVSVELLLASGFERVLATGPKGIRLEPLDRKLIRFARDCLTRAKRQQLGALLTELEVNCREMTGAPELLETIERTRARSDQDLVVLDTVAAALLKSGMLGEDRLERAERESAERYVRDRIAELQARIDAAINDRRSELQETEQQLKELSAAVQQVRTTRLAELDRELEDLKSEGLQSLARERAEFELKRGELERQEIVLKTNLAQVTKEFRDAGDQVVNRFLTIAPLLGALPSVGVPRQSDSVEVAKSAPAADAAFTLPAFVRQRKLDGLDSNQIAEDAFLDRFRGVVAQRGFSYRTLDLHRFHLSVKCGDLTVLGGPSGTGKSSLPVLYSEALIGSGEPRPGCLMVNVSPAWMDLRDLLGHFNTLEGRFYPSETGLFQYLVFSQEEFACAGSASGLYLACLDEMNLSHVEHYFSDLMMVLERSGDGRGLQCFSPAAARPENAFMQWARVQIAPSVRFVGTVNFDETTRLLSDRFLDRVNLIRLSTPALSVAAEPSVQIKKPEGPMVTLGDFERWRSDKALPPEFGGLLDQMRPILDELGCGVSPRVYRAICRFVGSSTGVMSGSKAFDIQVAQRVFPKLRSLRTSSQLNAADALLRIMESSALCTFDESLPLLHQARDAAGQSLWNLEDPT